jgi:RNA polymerase sigma-70 factor (ECF subfamily)
MSASRTDSDFEYLFLKHYRPVVRLLLRLTGNQGQAEELANEVFWRLSRQPARRLLDEKLTPWLYRTATNAGIDAIRATQRRSSYETSAAIDQREHVATQDALNNLLREEARSRVRRVLARMRPARARLLLLRSCGSSYQELAESLGVSVGSVGTLLNRAEREFREKYLVSEAEEKAK